MAVHSAPLEAPAGLASGLGPGGAAPRRVHVCRLKGAWGSLFDTVTATRARLDIARLRLQLMRPGQSGGCKAARLMFATRSVRPMCTALTASGPWLLMFWGVQVPDTRREALATPSGLLLNELACAPAGVCTPSLAALTLALELDSGKWSTTASTVLLFAVWLPPYLPPLDTLGCAPGGKCHWEVCLIVC